jgi:hypothetical protein
MMAKWRGGVKGKRKPRRHRDTEKETKEAEEVKEA